MRNSSKKILNRKKLLLAIIIILIIFVTLIIILKMKKKEVEPNVEEKEKIAVYELPDTKYQDVEVVGITTEYLTDMGQNQTKVRMTFKNMTEKTLKDETFEVYLINKDEEIIGSLLSSVSEFVAGEEHDVEVILNGDLTSATQVRIEKK